jgi:hypothetical protein
MDAEVELEESGLSVSDYKPSDGEDNEEHEDFELEAEEPDTQMPQMKAWDSCKKSNPTYQRTNNRDAFVGRETQGFKHARKLPYFIFHVCNC